MSITVDTINLRFNVTPDYKQQQLQQLQEDLKQSQKNYAAAEKQCEKYSLKVSSLDSKLSDLKARRDELSRQSALSPEESKEFDSLNKSIQKTDDELKEASAQLRKWVGESVGSAREMRDLEQRMQQNTRGVNLFSMSINQLRERQKDLNAVLNNLNPHNEAYQDLKNELDDVNRRMKELRQASLDMHEGENIAEMSANELTERLQALNAAFRDCNPEDEEFHRYAAAIKETQKQLDLLNEATRESKQPMLNFHNEAKLTDLTLDELQERLQALNATFRKMKPGDEKFESYAQKIAETKDRIKELNDRVNETQQSLSKFGDGFWGKLTKGVDFGQMKTMLSANAIGKVAGMVFDTITEYAGRAVSRVKDLVAESVQAARAAEGIQHAFKRIDQPGLLDNLRKATHGTVTDIELIKAAVQANDFRLPLDQLGKYLEFAQLKAQQTGQSVDYMTNSIVTGLGRKSLMILDNLGISASEVKEEMEQTGDMATAVGNIIDRQLKEAGAHFEDAAEREKRATTDVSNAQLRLGEQMKATFGIGTTSLGEMQAKAEVFILNGLTKLIIGCQDLYNRLGSVRLVVELVKVAFDTVFKVCEIGFRWLADTVKLVARGVRDLVGMLEGVLTLDFDKAGRSWDSLMKDISKSVSEFVSDGKNVGMRWGNNVVDSIRATMGKAKVKGPEVEMPRPKAMIPEGSNTANTAKNTAKSAPAASTSPADDNYQRDLATREQAYREYVNQLKQMYVDQLLSEDEYQQESLQAESKYLADKIALQEAYGKDSTQTQGQYLDLLIREANDKQRQGQQQLKDSLAQADADHAEQTRLLMEQRLSGELDTEKRYNELKLQADIDYQRRRLEILRAAGADTAQAERELLELQLQQRRNKEQEETAIIEGEGPTREQIVEKSFQSVNNLLSSASQLFSAMQQRETQQVDEKYKKLIAKAKKQGKDTTKLEEQQEAEKAEIRKKYAQKQFAMQVLQIVANTAQGVMKTIAELGMPWAIPFVAMTTAAGAMQLAAAKASADQAAGLYEGGYSSDYERKHGQPEVEGYTEQGNPREQAGVIPVHKNEFVANHRAVANPEVRPVLDVIDRHQKAGDIQMLNSTRMLEEAYGSGRYRGGYSRPSAEGYAGVSPADGGASAPKAELSPEVMDILTRIADNTADALTVRELRDRIRREERMEQNARR